MPEDRALSRSSGRSVVARVLLPFVLVLLTGCGSLPAWLGGDEGLKPSAADAAAHDAAQRKLHLAVQAAQPGHARLAQARQALESLLADDSTEARAHHPYARALLEQIRERQRLSAQLERLNQELDERNGGLEAQKRELEALHLQNTELQKKLDALTEIERRLSPPALQPDPGSAE